MKTNTNTVPRAAKGTPTNLNLWVLKKFFAGADVAANRIDSVSVASMRRCLKAGLVTVTDGGKTLTLTDAGRAAIAGVQ